MEKILKNQTLQQLAEHMRRGGMRQTPQRMLVLEIFLDTERHLTTQELAELVRRKYPGIGYATVARTVKLLLAADICRQLDFGDGAMRYEHKFGHEHHDHLICTKCGKFEEIFDPELEKLQAAIVKRHGYVENSHKLDIFGICPVCQPREESSRRRQRCG